MLDREFSAGKCRASNLHEFSEKSSRVDGDAVPVRPQMTAVVFSRISGNPRGAFVGLIAAICALLVAHAAMAAADLAPAAPATAGATAASSVCQTIDQAAATYNLPVEFFTRLIWQESRFDVHAIS